MLLLTANTKVSQIERFKYYFIQLNTNISQIKIIFGN